MQPLSHWDIDVWVDLRISSKRAAFPFFILEVDFQLRSEPGSPRLWATQPAYSVVSLPHVSIPVKSHLHGHEQPSLEHNHQKQQPMLTAECQDGL